jgi:hypothetical protein
MSFLKMYRSDGKTKKQKLDVSQLAKLEAIAPGISDFLGQFAGTSFNKGLYRIHEINEMRQWTATVGEAFPDFGSRIFCFSYDWLGRHFAIDGRRRQNGECLILMLEPGTGQSLEIPATFRDFHDTELVEYQDAALAADFQRAWLAAGGAIPSPSECVGYKKPLFLGGVDALENLELTDMDVYWSVCAQLLAKVRNLPPGTKIGKVDIQ